MRPTFTIRDWIWFCLVFALVYGWFSHWSQRERQHAKEIERLQAYGQSLGIEISARDAQLKYQRESAKDAKYKATLDQANREARSRQEMQALDNRLIEQTLEFNMRKA